MTDLNFDRSVVFMLEHADEGALGVVLNRPSPIAMAEAVPQWASLAAEPPVVFIGGPVGRGSVIVLAEADADLETEEFTPVLGSLGVLDVSKDPEDVVTPIGRIRLFTGYSGWGPGQLDRELRSGAWLVLDPDPSDPLSRAPEGLWTELLKRTDGIEAMHSQDPRHHWLN